MNKLSIVFLSLSRYVALCKARQGILLTVKAVRLKIRLNKKVIDLQ